MITETTEYTVTNPSRGWLFYDDQCAFCTGLARRFCRTMGRHGFGLAPLRGPSHEMRLLLRSRATFGGADALVEPSRRMWWGWPVWVWAQVPGARLMLRAAYRWVAARRDCVGGRCQIEVAMEQNPSWICWVLVLGCGGLAFSLRPHLPAWGFMWAMAFAMFVICTWITWSCPQARDQSRLARAGVDVPLHRWSRRSALSPFVHKQRPPAVLSRDRHILKGNNQ